MPRRKNVRLDESCYQEVHRVFSVTATTSGRLDVFADQSYGIECMQILRGLRERTGCPVFAYCLMPDHAHLLLGVSSTTSLSDFIGAWKSLCYRARRLRGAPEAFWQRGFYERAIRSNADLHAAALYVLGNPVRAGLVSDWREYGLSGSMEFDL